MKPAAFAYEAPASLDDAVRALGTEDAKVLAGGQSLVPILALRLGRFGRLVDLRCIEELRIITSENGSVRVGSMVRQADAERDPQIRHGVPLLPMALQYVGHFQIRNLGTIGGSIAHADPAAELPAVALALDATMEIAGPGGRRAVPAAEFFVSSYTTVLGDDEILSAVTFPRWPAGTGFAVEEIARRRGDFALVGAVCAVHVVDGVVERCAVSLFAVGPTPIRATDAEAILKGQRIADIGPAVLSDVGSAAMAQANPATDVHASAEYRKHVGVNVVATAIARALKESRNA